MLSKSWWQQGGEKRSRPVVVKELVAAGWRKEKPSCCCQRVGGSRVEGLGVDMAKIGIDCFLLDCRTNDNIYEIETEYGVKGFAVVVRLWQKIYCEKGYYCEWIERSPLLFLANWFSENSGVTISLITEIVNRCLQNGMFDARMYENYSILTSERIQKQYFDVVKRREEILVKKEYLLISVDKIKGIVYKNTDSVDRNEKNAYRNDISKVKKSKGKESKEIENATHSCTEPEILPSAPPIISLPLNDKTLYDIFVNDMDGWKELYPAVDILQELRKMKGWLESNVSRRKTRRGIKRFINSWLAKEQDKGHGRVHQTTSGLEAFINEKEFKTEPEEELIGDNWMDCETPWGR